MYTVWVGLGIKHLRFDAPRQCLQQTCIVWGKGRAAGFRVAGGFAICDFSATVDERFVYLLPKRIDGVSP